MSHTEAVKHLKLERCEISEGLQISGFISVHSVECVVVSIVTVCSLGTIKKLVESMSRWRPRLFSTRGRSLQCPIKAQSRSYKLIIIVTVMKLLCVRGCGVGGNSDTNTSSLNRSWLIFLERHHTRCFVAYADTNLVTVAVKTNTHTVSSALILTLTWSDVTVLVKEWWSLRTPGGLGLLDPSVAVLLRLCVSNAF